MQACASLIAEAVAEGWNQGDKEGIGRWQPHQPHPGTRCSRYGCFLPDLTRLTGNHCEGTGGATMTHAGRVARQAGVIVQAWPRDTTCRSKKTKAVSVLAPVDLLVQKR